MHLSLPRRAPKFEWNLNTIIQLVTLTVMLIGGVAVWVNSRRDIDELKVWRVAHENLHKDRLAEVKGIEAAYAERFRANESDTRKLSSQMENTVYRVTVLEQSTASVTQAIKDLQSLVSQQSGDLRVMKEILQRIEAQPSRR